MGEGGKGAGDGLAAGEKGEKHGRSPASTAALTHRTFRLGSSKCAPASRAPGIVSAAVILHCQTMPCSPTAHPRPLTRRIDELLAEKVDIALSQSILDIAADISCGGRPIMELKSLREVAAAHPSLREARTSAPALLVGAPSRRARACALLSRQAAVCCKPVSMRSHLAGPPRGHSE